MVEENLRRRVVITGYGMITPLGKNATETFERASEGCSGIDYIKAFDVSGLPCQIGGEVDDQWFEDVDDARNRRLDKFSSRALKLMRIATRDAVGQAKLDEISERDRIGVSLGSHGDWTRAAIRSSAFTAENRISLRPSSLLFSVAGAAIFPLCPHVRPALRLLARPTGSFRLESVTP